MLEGRRRATEAIPFAGLAGATGAHNSGVVIGRPPRSKPGNSTKCSVNAAKQGVYTAFTNQARGVETLCECMEVPRRKMESVFD